VNIVKLLTFIPIRYLLPALWIVSVIIASLYAYHSVKNKHIKNALKERYVHELNFFEHSKETASLAMKTVEMKHLKKIFTLFSTEKERTLGIYSFKEKVDISPTNLTLLIQYDGYSSTKQFKYLREKLCKENKVISLEVKEGLWYFFSTIGDDCNDLLYFERVNVIDKISHDQKDFLELVLKFVAVLVVAMIVIRTLMHFIFYKRLTTLLKMMVKSSKSLTYISEPIEGNDEIAQMSRVHHAASVQLSAILNDMYTFVALIDAQGKVIFVNNTPLEVSGLKFDDVFEKPFCDAVWWSYSDEVKEDICQMLKKAMVGEKIHEELEIEVADKQRIWINFSIHPVYNKEGHLLHLVAEGVDITRQKEAYAKLLEQNPKAQMGEMMDAVAHQWKQPLNALSMQADLLNEDFLDGKIDEKYIDELTIDVFSQIEHMQTTLSEFRSFLRPNSKTNYAQLLVIVQAVQLLIKDEFLQNKINILVDISEDIKFFVNENEFKHILLNILNNAKDAFNENETKDRKIKITLSKDEEKNIITITDNAGGVPAHVIKDIFKPNVTTKEEGKGTGIGLYMSDQIAQKMGGHLRVENVKAGAKFILEI